MKGLNTTQLITALAVGLIIIGVLAWLLIEWLGKGSGEINEQACRTKAITLCKFWKTFGYSDENKPELNEDCTKFGIKLTETYCDNLDIIPD